MKDKLIIIIIVMSMLNILILKDVDAKYVYTDTENIFKIQTADNIFPEINGRNYNVQDESFNTRVTVNFFDNLGIKYAKYWFKEEDNLFLENDIGTIFNSGITFENSGYYKIEVSDLYNNKVQYTFVIDKEVNKSEINIVSEDNNKMNLNISLEDIVSGVKKAEVYLDGVLYKTYDYSSSILKQVSEEIVLLKENIDFYEDIYVICWDYHDNSKKSESIILNPNKIYDLEDLYRFNNTVNSKVCNFAGKTVTLMSDLDFSLNDNRSWYSIIDFRGEFDGKYHTISGFYMDTDTEKTGFFGSNYGVLRDFTVIGELNSSKDISAGICAENFGQIVNCRSKVTINSNGNYVGGIARNKSWIYRKM